jgi:hypothetical protein
MDRDSRAERDAKIYACRIDGMPLAAIARQFNLATETVREITRRMERKARWLKYIAQLRGEGHRGLTVRGCQSGPIGAILAMLAARTHMAEKQLIVVRVAYDPEAKVWWTEPSELFGLNACAASLDEFRTILPGMIRDLIELNEPSWLGHDITVEIIAIGREHINIPAAA